MLLSGWTKQIFRPDCNPSFTSLHCIAYLDQDVGAALPYLNARLGGFSYCQDPPSVTFRIHGRLITVHADRIAMNALAGEDEAERILAWLQREINQAWDEREDTEPCFEGTGGPQVFTLLRLLPSRAGCSDCGAATCMVMASRLAEGGAGAEDCPHLEPGPRAEIEAYLAGFPQLDL